MDVFVLGTLSDNFTYALIDHDQVAVVDPGEAAPVRRWLNERNLKLTHVLLTHHHHDHVGGVGELVDQFGGEVWCSAGDRGRLARATRYLSDGERMDLMGDACRTIATPGHTRGHVCFYFEKARALFSGDTLFGAGCGRLFEGSASEMHNSLEKLRTLPDDTKVYFGHEYTITNLEFVRSRAEGELLRAVKARLQDAKDAIEADRPTTPSALGLERRTNPFLRARTSDEFAAWRLARDAW